MSVSESLFFPGLLAELTGTTPAWEPFRDGVEAAWLYRTDGGGPASALLRYAPGATVPLHRHQGFEHILILEGSQSDGATTLNKGDVAVHPPGSEHRIDSPTGCTALLIWEKAPLILE